MMCRLDRNANDSSSGRVENGRGSLGPMANAPFPIPAHRTGHNAVVPMDRIPREPTIAAPCHLVPSGEEGTHALADIVVDAAKDRDRRP